MKHSETPSLVEIAEYVDLERHLRQQRRARLRKMMSLMGVGRHTATGTGSSAADTVRNPPPAKDREH